MNTFVTNIALMFPEERIIPTIVDVRMPKGNTVQGKILSYDRIDEYWIDCKIELPDSPVFHPTQQSFSMSGVN